MDAGYIPTLAKPQSIHFNVPAQHLSWEHYCTGSPHF